MPSQTIQVSNTYAALKSLDNKTVSVNTGAVVVASSSLPLGASTEAKQDAANSSLSSINSRLSSPVFVSGPATDAQIRAAPLPITGTIVTICAGSSASGVADSGNPVKIGGVFSSPMPTLVSGNRANAQMNRFGELSSRSRNNYSHLSGNITKVVRTGAGVLSKIILGAVTSSSVITVYDDIVASSSVICVLTPVSASACSTVWFDCEFSTGLTVAISGPVTNDITVVYL